MKPNNAIYKFFLEVLTNSLTSDQANYIGEKVDYKFNIYKQSGFSPRMPIPRKTAAETLLNYFDTEEQLVEVFVQMLNHEGIKLSKTTLNIWEKEKFIALLEQNKWIYDAELKYFLRDPFYEHEINVLNSIRMIDMRTDINVSKIIKDISEISQKLSIQELEWRINMRMYDLEPKTGELIRKILDLLLIRQNLKTLSFELYTCLKELAINASKANYKQLFEKSLVKKEGNGIKNNYAKILELFKQEIEENGNKRLLELAKQEDSYFSITFQSTKDSIEIWVNNNASLSVIEKQQLVNKLQEGAIQKKHINRKQDRFAEGAGLGINLILSILRKYSEELDPLKIVFYPKFVKIGFQLKRSEILEKLKSAKKAD